MRPKLIRVFPALLLRVCLYLVVFSSANFGFAGICEAQPSVSTATGKVSGGYYGRAFSASEEAEAVEQLRAQGQAGVELLFADFRAARGEPAKLALVSESTQESNELDRRFFRLLDRVCGQRYCSQSRLFWHTDYKTALEQSKGESKPILALVLLGDLREELSCANSRFFRSILYSDPKVSKLLREEFVLFWMSERAAPRIEIDFGDGRKIVNTITGNSIHYILDAEGRVIDGLPGLYGPEPFIGGLKRAILQSIRLRGVSNAEFVRVASLYHGNNYREAEEIYGGDLQKLNIPQAQAALLRTIEANDAIPAAYRGARLATSKMRMEQPVVTALGMVGSSGINAAAARGLWSEVARLHPSYGQLSSESEAMIDAMILSHYPKLSAVRDLPFIKSELRTSLSEDTVRNETNLHQILRSWLSQDLAGADLTQVNEKVYQQLFLMPKSDPWNGLIEGQSFTALFSAGKP